jgi:signal transduction histidine kinase
VLRKDGSVVSVECLSLAIEFEGAPGILTFLRDVTQRNEAQSRLIQTDRMAAIGTLAAGVAHELNNPLAYVLLNMGLLERDLEELVTDPESRARVDERLRVLREGAGHMASVVRDLRCFCREDSPPRRVDVRQVLDSAIDMTMHQLKGRARLVRDYRSVDPVWADGARLGQVFLNLLINAAQALPEDGDGPHEIRVVLQPHGAEQVRVEFTDTGRGIPAHLLDRIFDPFFTTKPPGVGTGLGLSISKSIVQDMKGQLTVESREGRGSTFAVLLPTARDGHTLAPDW